MIEGILIGLTTALTLQNIFMVMIGCFFGTIIGMLPGLGPMTAIALMIPITYGFDPATGLILMAGVYYGAVFGGSTSSILLNAPGVPGTVATSFDGYPMAQQGKAGKALAIAAWSSFAGGTLSAIYLLFMAPSLSKVSLSFRSPDYFALMILGLTAIAAFSSKGQFLKAMMMVVLGLMLASVGQDSLSDITRFTFDNMNLTDGISFVLVVMATFAMSEALTIILKRNDPTAAAKQVSLTELGSIKINKEERGKMYKTIPRSSVIGFLIGVLPGAGATIASFLAYGMERNLVKDEEKEKFGKGSVNGLSAPETANNAACSGSFVPMLTLGIPGSGTTAVMLGALLGFGIQPGPRLYMTNPEIFWSVIMSMYIGMVILLILNLPLIPYIARILAVPKNYLIPLILFFSITGIYVMSFNNFDIYLMIGIAVVATFLRLYDFPMPPLILAFVLGGLMEENLRRSLLISDGSFNFLWDRPLTAIIFGGTILLISWLEKLGYMRSDGINGTMPNLAEHVKKVTGHSLAVSCLPMGVSNFQISNRQDLPDNFIITKVKNRRVKDWSPKKEEGTVKRVTHLQHIDLSEGNWLLLGRTKKIRNEMIEAHLKSLGMWYGRGEHRPVSRSILNAIEAWNRLQNDMTICD